MTGWTAEFVSELPCWSGPVEPRPLHGGTTNTNFVVNDGADTFVVRLGDDLPNHGILRSHELAACVAAYQADLSPEIVHHQPGALVMRFVDARTLDSSDIGEPETLARIARVLRICHNEVANHLRGPTPMFWVFHVCRGYLHQIAAEPCRLSGSLAILASQNDELEQRLGPINPVFCHNDLLAANFMDDGEKLWLLDWEYAGWNSAWFDLGNLSSNNQLTADHEEALVEAYLATPGEPSDRSQLEVMKCASLLRETLWNLTQERQSTLEVDYAADTDRNLAWFEAAYDALVTAP